MFISPSVYLTKCFLSKLCSLGQPLPKFAVVRNFVNHCNRAITFQALQPGGRLLFIADQQHTQSLNVRHTATGCFCSGSTLRLHGCLLARLPAFIPYAKVKKLILTHYILFIWKDKCMFFSDAAFPSRMLFSPLPDGSPWHQHLCHSAASRHRAPASSISATAAPQASNKPHSAEKYSGLASNLAHLDRIC